MRIPVIFAHPVETSHDAASTARILAALAPRHGVDPYAKGFVPVMSRAERPGYHRIPDNRGPVEPYVPRLMQAKAPVFCCPAWSFRPPAALKGWLDRVMLPGVSFHIQPDRRVRKSLTHPRELTGRVTHGQTRWRAFLIGDCPRRIVRRYLRRNIGRHGPALFLAQHPMNASTDATRRRFPARVAAAMARF